MEGNIRYAYLTILFINLLFYNKLSERDGQPICLSNRHRKDLKRVLLRAVNKNQILILSHLENNFKDTISSKLNRLSKESKIPISTLKLNSRILKDLNLIDFGNSSVAEITEFGKFVASIIRGGSDE